MTHETYPYLEDTDTDPKIVTLLKEGRRDEVSDEAYADTVNKILYRLFDGDYISPNETDLCDMLPELRGQPVVTPTFISPKYLDFLQDHDIRHSHYPIIYRYFSIKMANLEPLTEAEIALIPEFAELDEYRAVTVAVTPDLLQKAAANPDDIEPAAGHAITHYLTDKLIDDEPLTADDKKLILELLLTEETQGIDKSVINQAYIESPRLHPESASLEYGYDIYDYEALLKRLQEHLLAVSGNDLVYSAAPLDYREIRVIKRIWGFDPGDIAQINAVIAELHRETDVLRPESRDEYVARKQRYRKPRNHGFS